MSPDGGAQGEVPAPSRVRAAQLADGQLLGRQDLGTIHAVGQALAVAPATSVAVVGPLITAHAGAAAPLIVAVSLLATTCLASTLTHYARRYAGAGGIYEWLVHAHGSRVGVAATGLSVLGGLVAASALPILVGLFSQSFAHTRLDIDLRWWSGSLVASLAVFIVMYLGVRVSIGAQLVLSAIAVAPFLVLAVALLADPADGHTLRAFETSGHEWTDLLRALLFGLTLFGGFELAAVLGDEATTPHRSIPIAMILTIAGVGAFYLLVFYAVTIGFGVEDVAVDWGGNPSALAALADERVGAPLGAMLDLAVIIDLLVVTAAVGNALARGLFALARDTLLPTPLAARTRYATPIGGIAAFTLAGLLGVALGMLSGEPFGLFEAIVVENGVLNAAVTIVLTVGTIRFLPTRPRHLARWLPVIAVAATVPVLALYGTLNPFPTGPARWGLAVVLAVVVLTAGWSAALLVRRPEAVGRAAALARTVPPPER